MMIDENQFSASLDRDHEAGFFQRPQILRSGQALGDAGLFDEADLAVRLLENVERAQLDQAGQRYDGDPSARRSLRESTVGTCHED